MVQVLGIKQNVVIDFHDKKKNEQVHLEGLYLYIGEEKQGVKGIECQKPLFVGKSKPYYALADTLEPGDKINVSYNRFGSIDNISLA